MSDPRAFDKTAVAGVPQAASGTIDKAAPPTEPGAPSLEGGPQTLAGRYELLSLLGVGGMGAVYRARDMELDEIVALKMLRRELMSDVHILARFRQEVKLARKVTHRHVARTFDIGEHGGDKFLTMEFIDGESLSALLARKGRLSLAEVVDIAGAVCAGLTAAHGVGIVHRDLKPDNVLLAKDGRVVITDFGIARAAMDEGGSAVKTMGVPIGTPAYMAPEQVEGSPSIDARADIYSLGAMLYELLTGERAWDGDSVYSVAAKRLVSPPPDPRAKRLDLPDAACRLVVRCMARKPEDRFATAGEVAGELAGLTLPAPGATAPPPPTRATSPETTDAGVKTVAVLPFRNGGPSEDDYLAEGLTDDLIDTLSMTKGLKVRPRGVVMGLKGVDRDPRELGAQLGVQVVVEGSVRRAGDRLRVNARVISVADGFQLWAQRFDRPAGDVFAVGEETARAVTQALTVTAAAAAREAPTDPAAIDLYLRARHEFHKHWRDNVELSIGLFKQALERAPDDPLILAGYSMALMRNFAFDVSGEATADEGVEAAKRALAMAPHLGEPHVALAIYLRNTGDPVGAAREARQAFASSPALGDAYDIFGNLLIEAGAPEEGIARLRMALTCEPRLYGCRLDMARAYSMLGQRELAEETFGAEPEETGLANLYWINRARMAMWLGDAEHARAWMPELKKRKTFPGVVSMLKLTAGIPLDDGEQTFVNEQATAAGRSMRRRAFFSQILVEIRASLSDREGALTALAAAEAAGLFDITWLDRCPMIASVRDDARFKQVHAVVSQRAAKVRAALGVP